MKGSKEEIKAIDLRSDYKVNPIGIHNVAPRLSWRMTAYGKNRKQSAYQIQVFKKESDIKEVLVWDSEKVYSGESVNIPYKGKQLASRERVYWKVRIWDEKENVSEWSEEAFFEAGLLNKTDWEAEWICAPEKAAAVYFRKVCNIEKQPKSGRLYISGLGYYEAYLNGKKCGEDVLTPNRTHYTERVFYHTYDITTAVVHGENVFGVELGNGWYNQKDKINEKKLWYGYPKLLFQIEIEYADGDKDVFISDENTKWHESPRIYNNIYFGEIYDARKESIGWREKDFEDLDWKFAGKAEKPGGELTKQKAPSDQKICELFPKKISEVTPGMYVIDFGQNMTGWVKMRVSGKEGDKVQLRFGEELWPDGKINYYSTGSGWKQQKDIYILSGKKEEYYEPAFTWHGFRYVEVQGYPGIPKREDFVAVHIRAGVERSGKFICSNALINQIQKASLWSMESGLHGGIPLDSPHRERQGYGGDALITAKAMMYSYDMHEFYSDWMDDFIDAQDKTTGFLPHTVPCQDGGGGPAWGSALIIITWLMYRYYGDTKSAEEYFDNMIHWMQFLQTGMEKGIVEGEGTDKDCLGEWSTPGEILIPPRFVNTFFYAYNAKLMTELAEVLGRSADAEYFQNQYNETVLSFRNEFYDSKNGRYSIGAQGTEAFANKLGAIRERELCEVKQYLEKHITKECEGNFDQEFVQKTAEELQKMVDEGVFASDSVALTDDEATEEFRQGRAAMWYSGNWKVDLLCEEGSPLEGKLTMVNWPAVSGADGDQNSFVGGASATLVASATSAHKKEAVEFMTFMSEHFSNYAYEEGAILPTWKYSGDMELKPFQQTLLDLMQGADGFCLAWDTLLDPETADVHSTSLQGIYAQQMTADDYVEAMAATR